MEPGTQIGPYEILEPLGKGGMGEVWLAEDTRLGRKVAIKVLPEEFAGDPERLARFEQEARAAAALNHPHIAVLHDVGFEPGDERQDSEEGEGAPGTHYLVQEFLQGRSLRERIDARDLGLKRALALAIEVAEGLTAAHRAGIVHRDLKPDNVFVTEDGHAKILDFGLAKLVEPGAAPVTEESHTAVDASHSPTIVATTAGQILGTAGYMAPEQVRGGTVDERTDLFSFGCVLYELVTGERPFAGRNVHDTLSRILDGQPEPVSKTASGLPPRTGWILAKCLAKEPERRYQTARDLAVDLRGLAAEVETGVGPGAVRPDDAAEQGRSGLAAPTPLLIAVALAAAAFGAGATWTILTTLGAAPASHTAQLELPLPEDETLALFYDRSLAISADGGMVVISVARPDPSALGVESNEGLRLLRRAIGDRDAVPIPGSEGGTQPVVSPDGSEVAFVRPADRQLVKLPIDGGVPIPICDLPSAPLGLDWSVPETIVFAGTRGSVWRVDSSGGEPEEIVRLDDGERARAPQQLRDGAAVLYTVRPPDGVWDDGRVVVQLLAEGREEALIAGAANARALPSGHLVYTRGEALWVRAFDPESLGVGDEAVPTGQLVVRDLYRNYGFGSGEAHFAVADDGTLVYVEGGVDAFGEHTLFWQEGTAATVLAAGPGIDEPRISSDGTRVVTEVETENGFRVDVCDLPGCDWSVLDANGADPVWSPDGVWVYYAVSPANRAGRTPGLYRRLADFGDEPELLLTATEHLQTPESVTADGTLGYTTLPQGEDSVPDTRRVWILPAGSDDPRPLLDEPAMVVQLHRSGRWFAYVTPPSEGLYIREIGADGRAGRRITVDTLGYEPTWSDDGTTLYYRRGDRLLSVPFDDGALGAPTEVLANFRPAGITNDRTNYDVGNDGRILAPRRSGGRPAATSPVMVVIGWFAQLERLIPGTASR